MPHAWRYTRASSTVVRRAGHARRPGLWLLGLGLVLAAAAAQATSPMRFDRLGLDAGLSELAVNVITQDSAGFLWVGTEDGLDRYDGYQFIHFTHDGGSLASLPNNFIADACFDISGSHWIATDGGGVVLHDPVAGRFVDLETIAGTAAAAGLERVRVLHASRRGQLWVGTRESGLAVLDRTTQEIHRFRHLPDDPDSLRDNSIQSLLEDRVGRLWIGTDSGVDVLDPTTDRIKHYLLSEALAPQGRHLRVRSLLEDSAGTIWIGSDAGLEKLEPASGVVTVFPATGDNAETLPRGSIEALYEDHEHRLWVGTSDGLARFDPARNSFDTYRNDPRDVTSLPDNHIVSLFEDRSGLLWVGTKFGGLAKWNPRTWSFGYHVADAAEGFASHNIISFAETHDGRLWIGTLGGGLTVRGTHKIVASGAQAPTPTLTFRANSPDSGLGDDRIMALMADHADNVWVGTMSGGLDRIAAGTLRVTRYVHDPSDTGSVGANGVMSLLEDSKGRVWVGTYGGGLSRLDPGTTAFRTYAAGTGHATYLSSNRITALAEDSVGRIWVGTDGGGLDILDPVTDKLMRFRHDPQDPHSLSSDTIYSLYIDPPGSVWIGTRGGGLNRVTAGARLALPLRFDTLTEADGLPNNTVYGVVPDAAGTVWLSTNHGLARLDPRSGQVSNYYRSHGLQADEFNFGAHGRTRGGLLLFGGANGYNAFDPLALQFNRMPPPVAVTRILKLGEPVHGYSGLDLRRPLHFGYRDDVITFEFAALDFAVPAANLFEYRLQGFDRGWLRMGPLHSATYTHLPGGHYSLQVRAANADGIWTPQPVEILLDVDPPPWKTVWAYLLYSLLTALLLFWVWSRQKRALARAAGYRRQLEHEVRLRTHELAERNEALQKANDMLEKASFCDPLTGLGNRRSLDRAMPGLIADLRRNAYADGTGSRLAVLLIDLDRLKPINDQYGHEAGDRLLIEVAAILKECARGSDKVVRWGGDEFVIVHPVCDLAGTADLAERIRFAVAKRQFQVRGAIRGRTSCSIGFSLYPFIPGDYPPLGWERSLSIADANLYRAKSFRNAWIGCCGTRMAAEAVDIETLAEHDLDAAERSRYVEVRRSEVATDETLELILRRSPANSPRRR